jgi:hypothetical protein
VKDAPQTSQYSVKTDAWLALKALTLIKQFKNANNAQTQEFITRLKISVNALQIFLSIQIKSASNAICLNISTSCKKDVLIVQTGKFMISTLKSVKTVLMKDPFSTDRNA